MRYKGKDTFIIDSLLMEKPPDSTSMEKDSSQKIKNRKAKIDNTERNAIVLQAVD